MANDIKITNYSRRYALHQVMFGIAAAGGALPALDTYWASPATEIGAAYSPSRVIYTGYAGAKYSSDVGDDTPGSLIDIYFDQRELGGTSRDLVAAGGQEPDYATLNTRVVADFVRANSDYFGWATATAADVFTAASGYMVASFVIDSIANNNANTYDNDAICADEGFFLGILLKSGGPTAMAYNWDGSDDHADVTSGVATGTVLVVEWIHSGGNVTCCVNGGTAVSAASGNTTDLSGRMRVFRGDPTAGYTDGKLIELVMANAAPSNRATLVTNMKRWADGFNTF